MRTPDPKLGPSQVTKGKDNLASTSGLLLRGIAAPLLFVSAGQINAVIPRAAGSPWSVIQVSASAGSSSPIVTWMERATPSLFTIEGSGFGPGAILNQDSEVNSSAHPAARGSTIALFGTGGGLTNPSLEDGQVVSTAAPLAVAQYVVAAIGPKIAKVAYAGAAPGAINGLIQVNVIIPDDAPVGPEVPVSLILSPYRSQSGVTVAIR